MLAMSSGLNKMWAMMDRLADCDIRKIGYVSMSRTRAPGHVVFQDSAQICMSDCTTWKHVLDASLGSNSASQAFFARFSVAASFIWVTQA